LAREASHRDRLEELRERDRVDLLDEPGGGERRHELVPELRGFVAQPGRAGRRAGRDHDWIDVPIGARGALALGLRLRLAVVTTSSHACASGGGSCSYRPFTRASACARARSCTENLFADIVEGRLSRDTAV